MVKLMKKSGRSNCNMKSRTCTKWHWTREEDELLIKLVKRYGPGNWNYIAEHIRGRTGKSCRLRWVNQLNPNVNKRPFNDEEQQRLLELHQEHGNKWSTIVSFFPGRTDNQLKNQYHVLVGTRYMKASSNKFINGGSFVHGQSQWGSLETQQICSQFSQHGEQFVPNPNYGIWMYHLFGAHTQSLTMADCVSSQSVCSMMSNANLEPQDGRDASEFIDFMGVGY